MRRFALALAALLTVSSCENALLAADLPLRPPVKAAANVLGVYPYDGSGLYWGVGTFGEAQKVTVTAPAFTGTSTFAAGGSLSAVAGYAYAISPARWVAVEGALSYANTGADPALGVAVRNRLSGTQRVMYGGDMSMLTQWLPNLSTVLPVLPPVPVGATNPLSHPYVAAVLHEARNEVTMAGLASDKTRITYGAGMGLLTQMTNGSVVDTWAEATSSSGAHLLGAVVERSGMQYRAGVTMKWGISRN